jgi:hypothetical protein
MSENAFFYTYSAASNQEVLSIRKKYLPKEEAKLNYNPSIKFMKEVINMNHHDQEFIVQKIRTQYTEKQYTELEELKALDAKAKKPANIFAYIYGSVGAIVMGSGMSLVMTDIGAMIGLASTMVPGIVVGIVGLGMVLSTYPIYKRILNACKKKYAPQIMALSEKIMKD